MKRKTGSTSEGFSERFLRNGKEEFSTWVKENVASWAGPIAFASLSTVVSERLLAALLAALVVVAIKSVVDIALQR